MSIKKNIIKKEPIKSDFLIVGIGASAGGLAAFEAFFSGMPDYADTANGPKPGISFVLVQHLAPNHKSILTELVKRYTRMQVFEVEDGMTVQPNCVYIIPPNHDMALNNGRLQLLEQTSSHGQRLPIDFFFKTLAQEMREKAICVILSGTGSDGTLGARAVKGEGGLIMAQNPESTEYYGMPKSIIDTGLVDYVLTPSEMPAKLISYAERTLKKLPNELIKNDLIDDVYVKKLFILLRSQTGHDFSQYKPNTVIRRIERRMAVQQIVSMQSYVQFLQETPAEIEALFNDLLIGVTSFFRDPEAFTFLEEMIIPALFENRQSDTAIRIWVPGCSTGEEAYSLAMLLAERIEILKMNFAVQIFATDIDNSAIETARKGVFPASIAADLSPERLNRFFTAEPGGLSYRVNKSIRDMLVFSEQNLIRDPPFSKLDLISCRNLLIYLSSDLQKKIIPLFHYSLNPEGFLFLGTSETISDHEHLFSVINRKLKVYKFKEDKVGFQGSVIGTMMPAYRKTFVPPLREKTVISTKSTMREISEQAMLKQIIPAAALVNSRGDILYLHGRTGMFLEPAPGEVGTANIIKMAREGLGRELTTALHKAVNSRETIKLHDLRVKTNGDYSSVNLTITSVCEPESRKTDEILFLIVFELSESERTLPSHGNYDDSVNDDGIITALQKELQATQEYLQTTHEELEKTNEELKSSNEELQSVNEELQSTNEELETSKEELQSVNEELSTINTELQSKVADLSRANNDMNNLLAGTCIGTIFVDHSLKILRFTPTATKIINLIQSDIGRPVNHILSNLKNYETLMQDVQTVLDTLEHKELEVRTKEGVWYAMRIQPYRTLDNIIEGAVLTFVDINEEKKLRESLEDTREILETAIEQSMTGILIAEAPSGNLLYMNDSSLMPNGHTADNIRDSIKTIDDYLAQWEFLSIDGSAIRKKEFPLAQALYNGEKISKEYIIRSSDNKESIIYAKAAPVKNRNGQTTEAIQVFLDITEKKETEKLLQIAEKKLQETIKESQDE